MAGFSGDGVTLDCHGSSFLSSPLHGWPWSLENLVSVRVAGEVCLKNLVPARVTGEGCLKNLVRVRIPGGPTNTGAGKAKHSASKSMRAPTRLSIEVSKCVQAPARLSVWFRRLRLRGWIAATRILGGYGADALADALPMSRLRHQVAPMSAALLGPTRVFGTPLLRRGDATRLRQFERATIRESHVCDTVRSSKGGVCVRQVNRAGCLARGV